MLPVVVDISFPVPATIRMMVERRIKEILCEPPKNLFLVRVTELPSAFMADVLFDFACRVTLCAIGAVPIQGEPEFILYRKPGQPDVLLIRHIAKKQL